MPVSVVISSTRKPTHPVLSELFGYLKRDTEMSPGVWGRIRIGLFTLDAELEALKPYGGLTAVIEKLQQLEAGSRLALHPPPEPEPQAPDPQAPEPQKETAREKKNRVRREKRSAIRAQKAHGAPAEEAQVRVPGVKRAS